MPALSPTVPPSLPSTRFDASSASPALRRERYRAHMAGSWRADLTGDDSGHAIESTVWDLGGMIVTMNDFPARRVERTRQLTRADQLDHYYVHLPLASAGLQVEADRDCVTVPPGAPVMMDLSQPFDTFQGAGRSMQAFMPRDALDELLSGPRHLHASRLQGATACLIADLMRSLIGKLPDMSSAESPGVAQALLQLVAATLAPTPEMLERARPAIESTLLRQACRYIELHLHETALDAAAICLALRVSRATLYRLFESYGGVSSHILERRLQRIHDAICGGERRPLARLAEAHGFKTAAHFSRAFRQQFGYAPSEATQAAQATLPVDSAVLPRSESLAAWIRPLRG